jgi:hypothetical protein
VKEDILVTPEVKALQGLAETIVVKAIQARGVQAQAAFIEGGGPVGHLVKGFWDGQDIMNQDAKGLLDGQFEALILLDVGGDEVGDFKFLEISLDDGMGLDHEFAQREAFSPTGLSNHDRIGA